MLASVVKSALATVSCMALCFGSVPVYADESDQTLQDMSRSYYGWLDKFENPSRQHDQPTQSLVPFQPMGTETSVENPSRELSEQQNRASGHPPSGSMEDVGADLSNVIFENDTAEPGKGLGCYYHRAYYSHLPLFKDGSYSLRGAFDVAETYQQPSQDIVSSPDEVPHQ